MSCAIKQYDLLKSHFDFVELEELEKYRLLTLKDKANKANYDSIVWLQLKIPYEHKNGHTVWTNEKILTDACKNVLDWIDVLKNFEKTDNGKQLSLFGKDAEDTLEEEPPHPTSDGGWSKYHKEIERINKSNLMKQHSFFELCKLTDCSYIYQDIDYKHFLPKTDKEMIELVKDAIVRGTSSEKSYGRFDDFCWDDECDYLCRDGALSNIELINRVRGLIRLYLVPFTREAYVSTDLSYSSSKFEKRTCYRYWFDGKKINASSWEDTSSLRSYELYDLEFIDWLRDYFNIPYKEVISDEDILKENLKHLFQRVFNEYRESFDAIDEINKAKNFKEFRAKALSHASLGNGGGSAFSIDGFNGSYNLFNSNKSKVLTIEQNIEQRISLNRSIEGLENGYREDSVYVYKLTFDEALEKAFELFNTKAIKQTTLFDFMAA